VIETGRVAQYSERVVMAASESSGLQCRTSTIVFCSVYI